MAHLKSKRGTKKFEYFLVKERNAESLREEKLRSLRVLKRGFEGKGFGSTHEPFKECVVLFFFFFSSGFVKVILPGYNLVYYTH